MAIIGHLAVKYGDRGELRIRTADMATDISIGFDQDDGELIIVVDTDTMPEPEPKEPDWSCVCGEGTYEPIKDCRECGMGRRKCTACGDLDWDSSISKQAIS